MPSRHARTLAALSLTAALAIARSTMVTMPGTGSAPAPLVAPEIRLQLRLASQVTAACDKVLRFADAFLAFGDGFWKEAGVARSASLVASVGWQASEGALSDAVECWEGRGCVPDRFLSDAVRAVSTALHADDVFRPRWALVSEDFAQADRAARQAYETLQHLRRAHPHVLAQSLRQLRGAIWSAAQQRVLHAAQQQLGQSALQPSASK